MTRQAFERELQRLEADVLSLGDMVERAVLESVGALKRRDLEAARRLMAEDREINKRRFAIESDCISLIATQQPMATDLRTLAAVLEIVTELERIADYAKGIAKITLMLGTDPLIKPLLDIPRMAAKVQDMLHRALDAFVRRDVELARAIPREDDEVDSLYDQVYRELLTHVIADPRVIQQANYLLWVAHNLERAADRVGNICERVVFTVTGQMQEMDSDD